MKRHEWVFVYTASQLATAAEKKVAHHRSRLDFWLDTKKKVMDEIKESGIDVVESAAGTSYISNKGIDPHIVIDGTLQTKLTEAFLKTQEHSKKIDEYSAWVQTLKANNTQSLSLNHDDYQYFFGG